MTDTRLGSDRLSLGVVPAALRWRFGRGQCAP